METELGKTYRDKLTGFTGVATAKVDYLTGCSQTSLQPRVLEAGKIVDPHWFDDPKLEPVEAERVSFEQGPKPGADFPPPNRRG